MGLYTMPDGSTREFTNDAEATEAYRAWENKPAEKPVATPKDADTTTRRGAIKYIDQADENSFLQNVLSGAGGAMKGLTIGARQVIPGLTKPTEDEVRDWKDSMEGLRGTVGGNIGEIGTGMLAAAPAVALGGASVPAAAAIAGAQGFLTPAESAEERVTNTGISTVLGAGGQKVGNLLAGRAKTGLIRNQLAPEAQANIAALEKLGYEVTPGQRTGSHVMKQLESVMANTPTMSGPFRKIQERNQGFGNKIVADALGETGEGEVGKRVLGNIYGRLNAEFDAARDGYMVTLNNPSTRGQLTRTWNKYSGVVEPTELVERVGELVGPVGKATREQLGDLSSKLRTAAESELSNKQGNRQLGLLYSDLKEFVEDQIMRTLPVDQQKTYKAARDQYRTLMGLQRGNVLNPSTGDVALDKLPKAMAKADKAGFTRGKRSGNLYDLAHGVGAAGVEPSDVGTKLSMLSMLKGASGLAAPVAIGAGLGGPAGAAAALLGEAALPRLYLPLANWASKPNPRLAGGLTALAKHGSPQLGLVGSRGMPEFEED